MWTLLMFLCSTEVLHCVCNLGGQILLHATLLVTKRAAQRGHQIMLPGGNRTKR